MADYYPLISRAIAGLDPSAPGEQRRALYERARSALIAQLRSVQPPLTESEITRERLSLEEAVRKVESEAAQRAREATRGGGRARAGDAFRATTKDSRARPNATPVREDRGASGDEQRSDRNEAPRPDASRNDSSRNERPQRTLRIDPPPIPPSPASRPQPPQGDAAPRAGASRQSSNGPQGQGVRGFRDITADANDLGRAAAQANRSARRTYANVPSPSPEFDRIEPNMEDRSGGDYEAAYGYDENPDETPREAPSPPPQQRTRIAPNRDVGRKRPRGAPMFPFKSAIIVGIVLILAGAGILWGPKLYTMARGMLKSQPATTTTSTEAPKDPSAAPKPKITDRVGQPSSSDQVAPVAQRVVLYDEDPADPKGKQYVGTAVWRTEQIKGANGSGDVAVRADIDIPDRKFKMTISFRRNTDSSLPASHTAELTFVLPPNFDGGGIANVPGILMKSNEQARGTPLAGLAVKVTDGFFLVGLSNVDADRGRNIQLLKERSWFDVPLVYTNQRRAIIAIEKGPPGERAFTDAFAAWGE